MVDTFYCWPSFVAILDDFFFCPHQSAHFSPASFQASAGSSAGASSSAMTMKIVIREDVLNKSYTVFELGLAKLKQHVEFQTMLFSFILISF